MGDQTELQFRRALAALVPQGCTILAAVSGGGDSVALLHLLARAARGGRYRVVVAHLDHGLRRGSRADRRFVERLALLLDTECVAERREVAELRRADESPEEAARRVRRTFLLEAAARVGADRIATGHTLDDQAETILMRLVRGAGATALTGMAEAGPGPFVRPLLDLERAALRHWLEERGLAFREDSSNRSTRYDRNRLRRRVLPLLVQELNPRAARHLAQAAGFLREDALYLDGLAAALATRLWRSESGGRLVIDAAAWAEAPGVLARRVARLALERAGVDPRRIGARHVEALLALRTAPGGNRIHLPGRLTARRSRGRIEIGAGPTSDRGRKA